MKARGVEVDYRTGDKLRQDLWREYKEYGEILRRLGSGWLSAVALGIASAGVSYYVFAVLLEVPLPRGPW